MEAHAYHHPIQSGIVFLPGLHNQFDDSGNVNPNIPFLCPPFSLTDPSVPPPPPFGVLVHHNPTSFTPSLCPLNPALLIKVDEERSMSLHQFMADEGLIPSPKEELRRKVAIQKLKQIVSSWIKKVAQNHGLPKHQISVTSATILTYGSYGLGVHSPESDIDALCVAPFFASMAEDFFVCLHDMLQKRPEVSEIHCVKGAKVPLIRFKFDGISIDLPYARLKVLYVPEHVDILNPFFTRNIDGTSWKSLSGVRANKHILQLVPNVENFQSMLRFLKLWAKRRGVYGTLLGYLGGVHLAVLAAFICRRHPDASLNALIMHFFQTFAFWPWPKPVIVHEGIFPTITDVMETQSLMPMQLPSSPYEYCHSNITRSTFYRIRNEFLRGRNMTWDLLHSDIHWDGISEPFPYSKEYSLFAKIYLSSPNKDDLGDWVGWVKSRFRSLLLMLEKIQGFCDPNPTEYVDAEKTEPNVVFYWGFLNGKDNVTDKIQLLEEEFMNNLSTYHDISPGKMELSILLASELPKNAALLDDDTAKPIKTCWKKTTDLDKPRTLSAYS
ncbi:nuclear poly(A) polymerase 3 isoform X1 [Neltuma alba]|uniref:nuclear poly(A) polymerase 3 isoform X1 n=1 Tax=Neltuma alba TaxID=207710 RepID=UPI0010A4B350|nr:nuclear poly(A) polymerase 3 isoform X1 [Prosopis alba]